MIVSVVLNNISEILQLTDISEGSFSPCFQYIMIITANRNINWNRNIRCYQYIININRYIIGNRNFPCFQYIRNITANRFTGIRNILLSNMSEILLLIIKSMGREIYLSSNTTWTRKITCSLYFGWSRNITWNISVSVK